MTIFSTVMLSNVIHKSAVKHVLEIKYRRLVCGIDINLSGFLFSYTDVSDLRINIFAMNVESSINKTFAIS